MMSPKRKAMRLKEYDYAQKGMYFITICTNKRENSLSAIRRGDPSGHPFADHICSLEIDLTPLGEICNATMIEIGYLYDIQILKYIIMPNHIHLILSILQHQVTARVAPTVGRIIGAYKSMISNEWLKVCKAKNIMMGDIWQRGYYDHIIRDEQDYLRAWQYIDDNPLKWELDEYYLK